MRDLSFYRGWLLAPLVAPLAVAVLGTFTPAPPEPLLSASIYLTMSLFFGALPYALLVVVLWRWLPGQSPGRVRAVALLLPLPMLAFNALAVHAPWLLVAAITYGWVTLFLLTDVVAHALGLVRAMPTTSFSGGDGARQVH